MRIGHRTRGMTLLETMLSTALLSMVGLGLSAMLMGSVKGWSTGTSKDNTTSAATLALQKLSTEIRDGRSAVISSDGTTLTVTFPRMISDANTGEEIYDLSANSSITRSYYAANGNLMRSVGGQTSTVARNINSVDFDSGTNVRIITVTLTSTENLGTSTATRMITGRISLRNYKD